MQLVKKLQFIENAEANLQLSNNGFEVDILSTIAGTIERCLN